MNLTVFIDGRESRIFNSNCVQGVTFSEEFSETLDSATITLTHVTNRLTDLKPYDDVYIYASDVDRSKWWSIWRKMPPEYSTAMLAINYYPSTTKQYEELNGKCFKFNNKVYFCNGKTIVEVPFYRHFLVDQFTESIVRLGDDEKSGIFEYKIELFSETKGLEKVQLPNISITQPLVMDEKRSIYSYLKQFVDLYSPVYKAEVERYKYTYKKKYSLSDSLKDTFSDIYSADFTLTNPTLRDVLTQLMNIADMLPVIKDGVIYAMDVSKTIGTFNLGQELHFGRVANVSATMSSDDYCDGVRRQYSGALSQDGICNFVEYLGFRNKNNALMTLDNMELETAHRIYKVEKMYICYFKTAACIKSDKTETKKVFLCKQDISKLIKLSNEHGLLNQDWREQTAPSSVDDLAKFKISTIPYTQGSNVISGWGTKYQTAEETLLNTFMIDHTYIENIVNTMDALYPYGINNEQYYLDKLKVEHFIPNSGLSNIVVNGDVTDAEKLKRFFFQIEYKGYYDGALIQSRDFGRDNIFSNDNSNTSLAILEKDGINQKSKLNRFANKTYLMSGRCSNVDELIGLGSVGAVADDDNVIIYKREYSIFDNVVKFSYAATQNFVLRNYFTSVFAKYRTYQLMSYNESVSRSETRKMFYLMSKTKDVSSEYTFLPKSNKYFTMFAESQHYEAPFEWAKPNAKNAAYISQVLVPAQLISMPVVSTIYSGVSTNKGGLYVTLDGTATDDIQINLQMLPVWRHRWLIRGIPLPSSISANNVYLQYNDIIIHKDTIIRASRSVFYGRYPLFLCIKKGTVINSLSFYVQVFDLTEMGMETATVEEFNNAFPNEWYNYSEKPLAHKYLTDSYVFTNGKSLCFNVSMTDNISGGNGITSWSSDYKLLAANPSSSTDYVVGSKQQWYDIVDSDETGTIRTMGFYIAKSVDFTQAYEVFDATNTEYITNVDALTRTLPLSFDLTEMGAYVTDEIGGIEAFYKDNKERIDVTYQIEPISTDKDIFISDWFTRLSQMIENYNKVDTDYDLQYIIPAQQHSFSIEGKVLGLGNYYLCVYNATELMSFLKNTTTSTAILCNIDTNHIKSNASGANVVITSMYLSNVKNEYDINGNYLVLKGVYTNNGEQKEVLIRLQYSSSNDYYVNAWNNSVNFVYIDSDFGPMSFSVINKDKGPATDLTQTINIRKNMFVRYGDEELDNTSLYQIHDSSWDGVDKTVNVTDVMKYYSSQNSIYVEVPENYKGKSISFWYFDDSQCYRKVGNVWTYNASYGSYRFVFGVNVSANDKLVKRITIYTTPVRNRDERIYGDDMLVKASTKLDGWNETN